MLNKLCLGEEISIMEFEELSKLIFAEMKPKLENNQGLSTFAKERAKFEGWLKVELCDSGVKTYLPPKFLIERDPEWCIKCEVCVNQCSFDNHYYDAEDI